jgi:hypothetical protein
MNVIVVAGSAHFSEAISGTGSTKGKVASGKVEDARVGVETGVCGVES